jgi:hypothetical protein
VANESEHGQARGEPEQARSNGDPERRQGVLRRLSRHVARPNAQAWVVIGLTIVGLSALVGDIPPQDDKYPPEANLSGYLNSLPEIQTDISSEDGSFLRSGAGLRFGISLPRLPRQHATIHGTISVGAQVESAGKHYLHVIVPEPATLKLELATISYPDVRSGTSDISGRIVPRKEAEERHIISSSYQAAEVLEVAFTTWQCGQIITADVNFSTRAAFTIRRGWARQDLDLILNPPTQHPNVARVRSNLIKECKLDQSHVPNRWVLQDRYQLVLQDSSAGLIEIEPANGQRLTPINPQPTLSLFSPFYKVNGVTRIQASIENVQARFWAEFAIQLLLLSVGALLGGTAFRAIERSGRD